MAKDKMTPDQRRALVERLTRGREIAKARKEAAAEAAPPEEYNPMTLIHREPSPEPEPTPVEEPEDDGGPIRLSEAELARIREEAQELVRKELAKANAAKKRELMKQTLDAELLEQRRAAGLTSHMDDECEILVDVAPFANSMIIDGTIYQHGQWRTVSRRQFESMREIMARSWDSEDRAGNPNKQHYRSVAGTMNPLAHEHRMDDGAFTLGLNTRINALTGAMSGVPASAA